jgi:hypothetical protein
MTHKTLSDVKQPAFNSVGQDETRNEITMRQIVAFYRLLTGDIEGSLERLTASPTAEKTFGAFLAHHQLLPSVNFLLRDHTLRDQFPENLLDLLQVNQEKLDRKNNRLQLTLPKVANAFGEAGIPFILLKGLHLALLYYGGIERRSFWDMDLLVQPERMDKARNLLISMGYTRKSGLFINQQLSTWFTHGQDFKKTGALSIDLHWMLFRHPGIRFDHDAIWSSREELELDGTRFQVLSAPYSLAFLLTGIIKDVERGSLRLRSVVDLHLILKRLAADMDWGSFIEAREREGIGSMSEAALGLYLSLFDPAEASFQGLREFLDSRGRDIPSSLTAVSLIQPDRFALHNKLWSSGQHSTSHITNAAWWAFSLPARLVIHRSTSRRRKKTIKKGRASS